MNLDAETLRALGYGDQWAQLSLRFPLYVVARRGRDWRSPALHAARMRARRAAGLVPKRAPLTEAQRQAKRDRDRDAARERMRAKRSA